MWSGFDVFSHPELAAQFSDSFTYINDIFQAVFFFCIHIKVFGDCIFFKHMYMYIAVGFFFIVYNVLKSPVFVQNIPECIYMYFNSINFHDAIQLSAFIFVLVQDQSLVYNHIFSQ